MNNPHQSQEFLPTDHYRDPESSELRPLQLRNPYEGLPTVEYSSDLGVVNLPSLEDVEGKFNPLDIQVDNEEVEQLRLAALDIIPHMRITKRIQEHSRVMTMGYSVVRLAEQNRYDGFRNHKLGILIMSSLGDTDSWKMRLKISSLKHRDRYQFDSEAHYAFASDNGTVIEAFKRSTGNSSYYHMKAQDCLEDRYLRARRIMTSVTPSHCVSLQERIKFLQTALEAQGPSQEM